MKKKIVLLGILAFVLTLAAGTLMGVGLMSRSGAGHHGPSWLATQLNLTAQQQEQMREIWSQAMQHNEPGAGDRRHMLQKERDDAMVRLIPAEQKAAYDKIQADYAAKVDAMNRDRSKAYQDAVEKTKAILNEEQRQKYDELLKKVDHHHGPRGAAGAGPDGPPATGPAGPPGN